MSHCGENRTAAKLCGGTRFSTDVSARQPEVGHACGGSLDLFGDQQRERGVMRVDDGAARFVAQVQHRERAACADRRLSLQPHVSALRNSRGVRP